MTTTWIMTADRAGARIFERLDSELTLVEEVSHEAGKLRDRDIGTSEPGRSYESAKPGRHALGKEDLHDQVAATFASSLADRLREGRVQGKFTRLVIAAEPRFLGLLRGALDTDTSRLVVHEVPKHLQQLPPAEVAPYVLPRIAGMGP